MIQKKHTFAANMRPMFRKTKQRDLYIKYLNRSMGKNRDTRIEEWVLPVKKARDKNMVR